MSFSDLYNKHKQASEDTSGAVLWWDTVPSLDLSWVEDFMSSSDGQAMTWPWTLQTPSGIQWVDIKQAPEWYITPQEQIANWSAWYKERQKGRL